MNLQDIFNFYGEHPHPDTIRKMDYTEYPQDFDFWNHIDLKDLNKIIDSLPMNCFAVSRAILHVVGHTTFGKLHPLEEVVTWRKAEKAYIWHCDTQEEEQSWRIQLKIDIAVFPEIVSCLAEKEYLASQNILADYCDKRYITLSFRVKKI